MDQHTSKYKWSNSHKVGPFKKSCPNKNENESSIQITIVSNVTYESAGTSGD